VEGWEQPYCNQTLKAIFIHLPVLPILYLGERSYMGSSSCTKLITHYELLNHYQHTIYITVIIQIIVTLHYSFPYIWYNITCTQWL